MVSPRRLPPPPPSRPPRTPAGDLISPAHSLIAVRFIFPGFFFADFPPRSSWLQPQGDYIELAQKRYGKRLDYEERKRKKDARAVKKNSKEARNV